MAHVKEYLNNQSLHIVITQAGSAGSNAICNALLLLIYRFHTELDRVNELEAFCVIRGNAHGYARFFVGARRVHNLHAK